MSWTNTSSASTSTLTFDIDDIATTTIELPDPLIDWLPNSCLYEKYLPTWHLVRSYK